MFGKHPNLIVFQDQPFNASPPISDLLAEHITPVERFFVRNHGAVPEVDPQQYRLRISGLLDQRQELSLADLAAFPRATVTATVQCAGNRRDELLQLGPIPGELPWDGGALSTATWSGVRLADVLKAAGVQPGPYHVAFNGLDSCIAGDGPTIFGGSIPLEKALEHDVLLADTMNGEPLPPVHGAPLRVVVPGYIGARSVKWLAEIIVQETPSANYFQSKAYHLARGQQPNLPGEMLGSLFVTALISCPSPGAQLAAGPCTITGYALAAGDALLNTVEVSPDGGQHWQRARLFDTPAPGVWCRWQTQLDLPAGGCELVARATDSAGNTMPAELSETWNYKGYMNNAWHRVRVHTSAE